MLEENESKHDRLLEFLYACPVGLVELDASGAVSIINPHAMKHLMPLAGGRDPTNFFAMLEGCAPELRNLFDDFQKDRGTVCVGHRIAVDLGDSQVGKDPKVLAGTLVKLGPSRAVATFSDITVQVAPEYRLKQAETWLASLISGVNNYAVLTITREGIVDSVNEAFTRQTGRDCRDVTGKSLDMILKSDTRFGSVSLSNQLRLAERDGWYLDESRQERSSGEQYWCQRLFAARTTTDGVILDGFSVVLRDVLRDGSDTSDLHRMLFFDHLTGAANRTRFFQTFVREQRRWRDDRQPLSLIVLDLDHFKTINDTHGHPTGDLVLKQITRVCTGLLRPGDLFPRLSGEEFAALLPNSSLSEATEIAGRLCSAVASMSIPSLQGTFNITASFGCCSASDEHSTVDSLIAHADAQLYADKRAGRNRVHANLSSIAEP